MQCFRVATEVKQERIDSWNRGIASCVPEQPRPSRGAVIAVGAVERVGMMYKSSKFRISSLVEIFVILCQLLVNSRIWFDLNSTFVYAIHSTLSCHAENRSKHLLEYSLKKFKTCRLSMLVMVFDFICFIDCNLTQVCHVDNLSKT